jgi:YHS domain-containing protein
MNMQVNAKILRGIRHVSVALALVCTSVVHAAGPYGPVYVDSTGLFSGDAAIGGYDPVAIFTQREALEGSEDYTYEWNEVEWRFVSEGNRKLFAQDPEKYTPQYGGHCAAAMGNGDGALVKSSAESWTLHDGKLYFNYNDKVMKRWRGDMKAQITRANENWKRFAGGQ